MTVSRGWLPNGLTGDSPKAPAAVFYPRRNPLYVDCYERGGPAKVVSLTLRALSGENEECLEVMAQCFEKLRIILMTLTYWEHHWCHGEIPPEDENNPLVAHIIDSPLRETGLATIAQYNSERFGK